MARSLVDIAGVLHPARTERAVDNCLGARLVDLPSLHATFAELAGRGRKGVAVMRAILAERPADTFVAPESELEARFLTLVRAARLAEPVRQLDTGDGSGWIGRVDFAYPDIGLLVELDGSASHTAKLDREADGRRDSALLAAGWRHIERFGWADVTVRPADVVARLRAHLVNR